ncbi:MAG: hypothetical protein ACI8TQ_001893 [Planctomycetota bacterium]|jgi:hypothetical protein
MVAPSKLCLSLALFLPTSFAFAQAASEAQAAEPQAVPEAAPVLTGQDILSLRTNGFDDSLFSPKDLAYVGAIKMLVARLSELPEELGEQNQIPPAAIPLVERLLYGQLDLRVGAYDEGVAAPLPVYFRLELDKQAGHAPFAELLTNLLTQVGMPMAAPDEHGHIALPIPIPVHAWFADNDGDFVLEFGSVPPRTIVENELQLSDRSKVAAKFRLDVDKLASTVRTFITSESDLKQFDDVLKMSQIGGQAFEVISGHDDGRSIQKTAIRNWGSSPIAQIYSGSTVSVSALNMIPADVEWAMVGTSNASAVLTYFETVFKENVDPDLDMISMIGPMIGLPDFDINRDFVAHLGTSQGTFSSRAAGGGFYSSVAFMDLSNDDAFAATLDQLEDQAVTMSAAATKGYFKLNRYDYNGVAMTSFQFGGLPIPVQPAYGISDGRLVMGISARAVEAAFDHAASGGPSLTAAPGFLEQLGGDLTKAQSVMYFDVPGLIGDGYFAMDLMTNLLANGVRSKTGAEGVVREPGQLLPSLADLKAGALPIVSMNWVEGNDLLSEMRMDRSMLVNSAALIPYIAKVYVPMFALFGGLAAAGRQEAAGAGVEEALEELFR